MFERRRGLEARRHDFDNDMDLRLCTFLRRLQYGFTFMRIRRPAAIRRRYGLTCVHVSAPAVVRAYIYECWSAVDDMELRFCMSQRRRLYGLTFMHMRASQAAVAEPMLLWLEFGAH